MSFCNNKCSYLYPANIGNAVDKRRAIENKIRYRSDPSRNAINLSKYSFFSDILKLLNKNLKLVPKPKKFSKSKRC